MCPFEMLDRFNFLLSYKQQQGPCRNKQAARQTIDQFFSFGRVDPPGYFVAPTRVQQLPAEFQAHKGHTQNDHLLQLWIPRVDKLGKERGKKDDDLGIADSD